MATKELGVSAFRYFRKQPKDLTPGREGVKDDFRQSEKVIKVIKVVKVHR